MAITIKDVARAAKVSVASVSRALNGHRSMAADTRKRILAAAKKLHYTPHSAARTLITRRTQTIGTLLPDLHGEFFSELIRGIDLAARARGLHLLVSSSHGNAAEAAAALHAMQGRVDGLLLMSPYLDASLLRRNLRSDLPIVLMNTPLKRERCAVLNVDNYGGAFAMVQHLVASGRRRIALIAGPERNFDASERLRGYTAAMARFAPSIPLQVLDGDFTEESGHDAARRLLANRLRPQAVFATNDMMAVGCLYAFREGGVRVPGDIAVTGFDDIPFARLIAPALTTVRVRIADFGARSLERLVAMIDDRADAAREKHAQLLGTELVVRQSCGAKDVVSAAVA
ncbi:MAG TPA: LacI family DNA-binding transcriptional regulator [Rudaea sp.]|jgi:LacI family transcriptional regulator